MKKLLLATLVAAASIGAAQADGPSLYGKINVSVDNTKSDLNQNRVTTVDSNASRFGIKGNEKLTDNLSAIYGIEWGVAIDNNSNNSKPSINNNTDTSATGTTYDLAARNRFIGLQYEGIGALKFGRLDTNVKTLQYINPAQGIDIADDYVNGSFDSTQTFAGENRINNVIALESAKFDTGYGVFSANFLVSPSEKTVAKNAVGTTGSTATSTSVVYANKDVGLYTAIGYDVNVASIWNAANTFAYATKAPVTSVNNPFASATNNTDLFRWVGSADLGKLAGIDGVTLNGLFQQAKLSDKVAAGFAGTSPKENAYLVSAIYKFPASILDGLSAKAQFQSATTKSLGNNIADVKVDQVTVDLDYAFSAKTKVYGFWAQRTLKNPNNVGTTAVPLPNAGQDSNYKYQGFGLGLEQKF
jgi:predicted porin